MRLPTIAAASALPPCFSCSRTSFSAVGGARDDALAVLRDHARVDVQVRAEDRQARDILLGDAGPRLTRTAQALFLLVQHFVAPYFFFVSFSTTRSSA
jgi:hypothetical protein